MIITTTDFITGKEIETLGIVKGSTVQTKNIGRDIAAGLKNLVGGELTGYTEMMNEARAIATDRMILEAQVLEADAVVGVRYATSSITQGAAEVIVYGTAVKFLNKE
ncbi:MAG: YbjQ family protein [Clostridia bacterium]|nr:YbjQ family protein [Clostridia bacterium]MBQ6676547.1 YbjQ family protein [Clostridia bacterium]MBR3415439.1 YbjQ family protein [Clostridia bacterium]